MKMSAATMPTKIAASSSIASMNRSMRLRRLGARCPGAVVRASLVTPFAPPPGGEDWGEAGSASARTSARSLGVDGVRPSMAAAPPSRPHPSRPKGRRRSRIEMRDDRRGPAGEVARRSISRLVFAEFRLELAEHGVGVLVSDLARAVGPGLGQRLCRLAPQAELLGHDGIALGARLSLDLLAARGFPLGPGRGQLYRPSRCAVVVGGPLLRRVQRV